MRSVYLVAFGSALLIAAACSKSTTTDDDDGTTTGTTTGTHTGTTTGTQTGTQTGTGTPTGTGTGSTDCGALQISADAACQTCAETSCCAELAACDNGTECDALMLCAEACDPTDDACIQGCATDNPDGVDPYLAMFDCLDAGCADACGGVGICETELSFQSVALTQCVNDSCCASFTPCYEDATCNACLMDPEGAGCDTNALYTALNTCMDANCPTTICTTSIGWSDTESGDPIFACNECDGTNCCSDLDTCDGDGSETATDLCITCLQDPTAAACTANTTVHDAAVAFLACQDTNCATECGG